MASKPKLAKLHNGKTLLSGYSDELLMRQGIVYSFEHITEAGEDEIIYTASIKINTKTKKGRKMILNALDKECSPLKLVLQNIEREHHIDLREGKPTSIDYSLPDEIMEKLKGE